MKACLLSSYDDYCDDTYAIKNNDNHETCHHDFNFHSHDSYFVEFAPTTVDEKKFAYVESNKFSMLMHHENNALCDSYIIEFIHDATENYYERGTYAFTYLNKVFSLCVENLEVLLVLPYYAS